MKYLSDKTLACLAFLIMGCWACSSEEDGNGNDNGNEKGIVWIADSAAKYKVSKMIITTEGGKAITSKAKKDAVNCTITIKRTRTNRYATQAAAPMARDNDRWPIGYKAASEISRMKSWLDNRVALPRQGYRQLLIFVFFLI